jgi:CRP-like cAMP-binding protein
MTGSDQSVRTLAAAAPTTALFLCETIEELNQGAGFLDRLTRADRQRIRALGRPLSVQAGGVVFAQGAPHDGIFLIDEGRIRVYYTAPSGREVTLAYWPQGHFIGGPEIIGGTHVWSGEAVEDSLLTVLPASRLQMLLTQMPNFALCLIEGLIAKGKCYSAMAQMLGTRSGIERLAQFLVNLGALRGAPAGTAVLIERTLTHDQIAAMVGSTRQWVTMMLKRFEKSGIISVDRRSIRIDRPDLLHQMLSNGAG